MVLLQGIIPFHQLSAIQRVSKGLCNVIEGSQQLKLKMFLIYDIKAPYPSTIEDLNRLVEDDAAPFFNHLMGFLPAPDKELVQMPIFRHFDFQIPHGILRDACISLCSRNPLAGAVEKQLKPHLGGSWERLKICRISPTLNFHYKRGTSLEPDFSLDEKNVTMGDLVEALSAWYSQERRVLAAHVGSEHIRLWLNICLE